MHITPLVSKDGVFSAQLHFAIEHYVDTRDQIEAALLARMEPALFIRAMRRKDVKAEIQRKLDMIDQANALLRAAARQLTADKLDSTLVDVLDVDPKETITVGERTVTRANSNVLAAKVKAVEVGYKRYGMLKEKMEHTGKDGAPVAFELVRIGSKKEPDGGK